MALSSTNLQISVTHKATTLDESYDLNYQGGKGAMDDLVSTIFSKMNEYLSSKGFTRVDSNKLLMTSLPEDNQPTALLCESYQYPGISNYLVVSTTLNIKAMYYSSSSFSITLKIGLSNELIQSSVGGNFSSDISFKSLFDIPLHTEQNTVRDKDNNFISATQVWTLNGNIIIREFKNDNVLLFKAMSTTSNDLNKSLGVTSINNDFYLSYARKSDSYEFGEIQFIKDSLIYYTQSFTLHNSDGVTTDGYIVTAPIYLTLASVSQASAMIKDLKLENSLQTNTNGICVHDGVYILDDESEYFALYNNLLLKM